MSNRPTEQRNQFADYVTSTVERWGRWHWVRVFGLTCFYFPFWTIVNRVRRMRTALRYDINLVTNEELWKLTEPLDQHPDDWEHPCMCATCRSYAEAIARIESLVREKAT